MEFAQTLLSFFGVYMFIELARSMWSQPMENAKLISFILFVESITALFNGIHHLANFLK